MTEQTAGNHAGPHIELPDEGMSFAELAAMTDAYRRRRLRLEADRQGRIDVHGNIIPKPANGNAAGGTAKGNGPAGATPSGHSGSRARQEAPIFIDPSTTPPAQGQDSFRIVWLPERRDAATRECGAALAERATRLFLRGEMLATVALPDPDRRKLALERRGGVAGGAGDPAKGGSEGVVDGAVSAAARKKSAYTPDPLLRRARIVNARQLRRQGDEAKIVFLGRTAGKPRSDGSPRLAPINPPMDVYDDLVDNPQFVPVPRLVAVARLPWMDDGGDLDLTVGYNPDTEVWQDIGYLGSVNVRAQPTEDDVRAAVKTLFHPFQHYEHDNSREFLGEILTMEFSAVERAFLKTCPAFAVIGHVPGVGKGRLCKAMAILNCGLDGDRITAGENREEFDKRFDSAILDNPAVLTIDNYNNLPFGNFMIESFLSEGYAKIRLFGRKGDDPIIDARMLMFVNGNNMWVVNDTARRCLIINLVTNSENPETRPFPFFPEEVVRRTRVAMLEAAYTCMRWWRQRGMRGRGKTPAPLGSFEDWSAKVGDLVMELTSSHMLGIEDGVHDDGWHPAVAITSSVMMEESRLLAARALALLEKRFGLGLSIHSTNVAMICARVEKARRDGGVYHIPTDQLDDNVYPALGTTKQHVAFVRATLDASGKSGKSGAPGYTIKQVEEAYQLLLGRLHDAETAAQAVQNPMEIALEEAITMVTSSGKTDGRAIGGFFRRISNRVVNGRKLVFDVTGNGKDARAVHIVAV